MPRLIVAAGGGGDAVAAALLHAAFHGDGEPAVILTCAWDRLLVDPVPGPRGAVGFTGLVPLTPSVSTVPADARPIAPAGSTLPGLAAALPHTLALLDPRHGAEGVARQVEELAEHLNPVDRLAGRRRRHPRKRRRATLRSPLADPLALAACSRNALARALLTTTTLDEAEARSRAIWGFSEIDHERAKAQRIGQQRPEAPKTAQLLTRLATFERDARTRGVTHTTFRRLAEALGLPGDRREWLRTLLITSRPHQYTAPLWRLPPARGVRPVR